MILLYNYNQCVILKHNETVVDTSYISVYCDKLFVTNTDK